LAHREAHRSHASAALVGFKKLADERGNANMPTVAASKAKTIRSEISTTRRVQQEPTILPGVMPKTVADLLALKQKVSQERRAKQAKAGGGRR